MESLQVCTASSLSLFAFLLLLSSRTLEKEKILCRNISSRDKMCEKKKREETQQTFSLPFVTHCTFISYAHPASTVLLFSEKRAGGWEWVLVSFMRDSHCHLRDTHSLSSSGLSVDLTERMSWNYCQCYNSSVSLVVSLVLMCLCERETMTFDVNDSVTTEKYQRKRVKSPCFVCVNQLRPFLVFLPLLFPPGFSVLFIVKWTWH